jgi:hypothetical protein
MEPTSAPSQDTRDTYIVAAFMASLVGFAALILGLH